MSIRSASHQEPPRPEPTSQTSLEAASSAKRFVARIILVAAIAGAGWLFWLQPSRLLVLLCILPVSLLFLGIRSYPGMWRRSADAPPSPEADLTRRRTAWRVLSELYLDTELSHRAYEGMAAALAETGYSPGQLEEILYRELHPILHHNLLCVAGEWAAFDLEWLEAQILRRSGAGSRASAGTGAAIAIIPAKWIVRDGWAALEARLRRGGA